MHGLGRNGPLVEHERRDSDVARAGPGRRGGAREASPSCRSATATSVFRGAQQGRGRHPAADGRAINALGTTPALLLHTGDLTHGAKEEEFDACDQILREAKAAERFFVPGEHDVYDDGKLYLERYGKRTLGSGWQSFDDHGVHFIGLSNVLNVGAGQLGQLGPEQLAWLKKDVAGLADSTPIVVFAHVPLWSVYPKWGWGTEDGARPLELLRRFGSVTVLNGHIHQTLQKVEGNITFHTACSTAFPQPKPGTAPSPGPMKGVPAEKLKRMLGLTSVRSVEGHKSLAIVDVPLEGRT